MKYMQVIDCYPWRMGTLHCRSLANVRLAFSVAPKFMSSNEEMVSQIKKSTFHFGLPPKNISVIVFIFPASEYGWCGLWNEGKLYIDGEKMPLKHSTLQASWKLYCSECA